MKQMIRRIGIGGLLVTSLFGLTGCDRFFPGAIEVSQEAYDFGLSTLPWAFQVWTDNPNIPTLRFHVTKDASWILCSPNRGESSGPDDLQTILVSIDRTKLVAGMHTGTITISAFGLVAKTIAITAQSDGSLAVRSLEITNASPSFTEPYLLDFTFSLRDEKGHSVVAEPVQFKTTCIENGQGVSPSETGVHLAKASDKQPKCVLVLDYTASMADPENGDANGDGKSDAIEAMENAANYVFLPALTPDALVAIYEFHRDRDPARVCEFTADKTFARTCIESIWEEYVHGFPGTSRCWDALYAAVGEFGPDTQMDESRTIVFLSDGRDESSLYLPQDVANAAVDLGVRVYGIGFGAELDTLALNLIATQTHGNAYVADLAADLPGVFQQVVEDLGGQYTLRWATLKRGEHSFTPSFLMSVGNLQALHVCPTDYLPKDYAGDTLHGMLRLVPSQTDDQTTLFLRAAYVPRYIRQIALYVRSPYDFSVSSIAAVDGGLCGYWRLTVEEDLDYGGRWIVLESPDPQDIFTALDYASFGPMLRLDFDEVLAPGISPFETVYVDNTIYENGQYFTVDDWPNVAPGPMQG